MEIVIDICCPSADGRLTLDLARSPFPERNRAIVALFEQGVDAQVIAERMDLSLNVVKSVCRRHQRRPRAIGSPARHAYMHRRSRLRYKWRYELLFPLPSHIIDAVVELAYPFNKAPP